MSYRPLNVNRYHRETFVKSLDGTATASALDVTLNDLLVDATSKNKLVTTAGGYEVKVHSVKIGAVGTPDNLMGSIAAETFDLSDPTYIFDGNGAKIGQEYRSLKSTDVFGTLDRPAVFNQRFSGRSAGAFMCNQVAVSDQQTAPFVKSLIEGEGLCVVEYSWRKEQIVPTPPFRTINDVERMTLEETEFGYRGNPALLKSMNAKPTRARNAKPKPTRVTKPQKKQTKRRN
jgi:hypothetical protein